MKPRWANQAVAEKTDQEAHLRDYSLEFLSKGPTDRGWVGQFYKCPLCGYFADRSKYDECDCGNISIDADYCRITVEDSPESDVEVYNAVKRTR